MSFLKGELQARWLRFLFALPVVGHELLLHPVPAIQTGVAGYGDDTVGAIPSFQPGILLSRIIGAGSVVGSVP